jgi:hypothetical protein
MFFVFQVLMDASPMTPYELYARGFSRTSRHTFWKVHSIVNSTCTRVYYSKHTYSLQWLYWLYTAHVLGCWLFILHVVFTYSIVTLLDKDNKASVKKKMVFRGCASLYTHSTCAGALTFFCWRLSPGKPLLHSVQMTPLMVCICVYVSVCIVKCFLFLFLFLFYWISHTGVSEEILKACITQLINWLSKLILMLILTHTGISEEIPKACIYQLIY